MTLITGLPGILYELQHSYLRCNQSTACSFSHNQTSVPRRALCLDTVSARARVLIKLFLLYFWCRYHSWWIKDCHIIAPVKLRYSYKTVGHLHKHRAGCQR